MIEILNNKRYTKKMLNFPQTLTANKLKIIAIISMFFDHFVAVFIQHDSIQGILLRIPGRISAPIICYFVAEGYFYTSNKNKYILRLVIFALISHVPYNLLFGFGFFQATSIIWGLALGLIALTVIKDDRYNIVVKVLVLLLACFLSLRANWNFVAVLWIVGFGLFRGNLKHQMYSFIIIGVIFHLIPTFIYFGFSHSLYPHWYQLAFIIAIPFLLMYNGKLGKKSKTLSLLFYTFYPGHMLLLYLIDQFTPLSQLLGN